MLLYVDAQPQPVFDHELEQSLAEFTILDQTESQPPPADPPATSTPSQPSLQQPSVHGQQSLQPSLTGPPSFQASTPSQQGLQPSLTGPPSFQASTPSQQSLQPSAPLTPMDTLQGMYTAGEFTVLVRVQ